MVGGGQPLEVRAHRRLAEHEPDPRRRRSVRPYAGRVVAQGDQTADGPLSPRTAVAVPSPRLRRSSPSRAWTGPSAPPSSRWMNPRTLRNASSKASHGLRSRHWAAPTAADVAAGDRAGRRPRPAGSPGGWRAGSRGAGRGAGRPGPARPGGRSRSARGSRRGPTSWRGVWRSSSSSGQARARRSTSGNRARSMARIATAPASVVARTQVVGVERRLALLGPAALVAADRAAVVPGRPVARAPATPSSSSDRPHDLVDDERPAAGRAARREQVADGHLEARCRRAARRPCPGTPRRGGGRPAAAARPRRASGSAGSTRARRRGAGGRRAARATQPPRPNRSATTSPGPVWSSIRAATQRRRRGAARVRSKTGSE